MSIDEKFTPSSRQAIRSQIRQRRGSLSTQEQAKAAEQLLVAFSQLDIVKKSQHIGLYSSFDSELETKLLIEYCWQQGKGVYLPVLHPFHAGQLLFLRYLPESPLVSNRFGIFEPKLDVRAVQPLKDMDLICTPLVAFDAQGQRLGMGGGFYDRTLSAWIALKKDAEILGLAHDCQQVDILPTEAWDIPLPQILTPSHYWQWSQ